MRRPAPVLAARRGGRGATALILLSAALLFAASAPAARATGQSGYANLGGYCQATYPPGYRIPVWWGDTPALYCTDDIGSPSHSYGPFSADDACAFTGLGPADPNFSAGWRDPNFEPSVHCGPYDTTPPSITISTPGDGASYRNGSRAVVAYSCADADSGVSSCAGSTPNGAPLDTSWSGQHVFTVTAVDRSGNTATQTVHYEVPADRVSVAIDPAATDGSGEGMVTATITDRDPDGNPAAGKEVRIEPPPAYDIPALVCDDADRFLYPSRLSDGSLLGAGFERVTDGAGQIHLTMYVGTTPGDWSLEAGEPTAPRTYWGHAALDVREAGSGTSLRPELPALLVAASDRTLADFHHSGVDDVLKWLGALKTGADRGVLAGVAFAPIHSVDASGSEHDGVVLFADATAVRQRVLSYLDGSSEAEPTEGEAIVIDVAKMQELLFGARLAGHDVNTVGYRLPSLGEWRTGGRIDIGENARGNPRYLPIAARGRARNGFAAPQGNEDLLYGYGPYPPFGGDATTQAGFAKCIGYTYGTTTVSIHSPVRLLVTGSHGRRAGAIAGGAVTDTIPGAIVHATGGHVTSVEAPSGSYGVKLVGTARGRAHLVVVAQTASGSATRVYAFKVSRHERGSVALGAAKARPAMHFGGHRIKGVAGLGLAVAGLPHKLKVGRAATLKLIVRDQFGARVPGVRVGLRGPAGVAGVAGTTDHRGRVSLAVDPAQAGKVTLRATGPGYRSLSRRLRAR